MLTQFLKPDEREELKKIIGTYKENRREIFESYVFPVGNEPNNASWTGFQIYHPEKKSGYLMVFRELHNKENVAEMKLKFIRDKEIRMVDLENSKSETQNGENGHVQFSIENPAGYKFLRYEIID
jgi:hypothetical protein